MELAVILLVSVAAAIGGGFILARYLLSPCPAWLSRLIEIDNPFIRVHQKKHIFALLRPASGMKLIDIGCGPGRLTLPLAKHLGESGEIWAVDIQQKMLDFVKRKQQTQGLQNIQYIESCSSKLELPTAYFDAAILSTTLGELNDRDSTIALLRASLKQNGIIFVTEVLTDPHFLNLNIVRNLFLTKGFTEHALQQSLLGYSVVFRKSLY